MMISRKLKDGARIFGGICLLSFCGLKALPTLAQSSFQPILESLDIRQQREQYQAAPSGEDEPLMSPEVPLQLVAESLLPEEASVFEELGRENLEPVSLEEQIQPQIVRSELQQYGYDLFKNRPSTFVQVDDLPVPPDYLIGPSDTLTVQLYGGRNVEYNLVVTRDGRLLLPELGPLEVSGMTFNEVKMAITHRYATQVIGVKAVVSMKQLRTIQIRLTGEVQQPGVYTVSGLSTLVDALLSTGGISHSGSLRHIHLKRHGETQSVLDLYDLLMKGDSSSDLPLQHGDLIYVPPIGSVVYIGGEVQRPAIYELKNETRLPEVINLAGGLLPTASIESSHVERIVNRRYRTLIDLKQTAELPDIAIENGDFVRILPVANTMDDVILLSGHLKRPGGYQLLPGSRLSELLTGRDQIMPNTDLDFALLVREQSGTRRKQVHFVHLSEALGRPGSISDLLLEPRDELKLFNLRPNRAEQLASLVAELDLEGTDYIPGMTATVLGHARFTGRFPLQEDIRLLDFLRIAGGLQAGVDMDYMLIASTHFPSDDVSMQAFSLHAAINAPYSDKTNPRVAPGDRIYLFNDNLDRSELMKQDLDRLAYQANYTDEELLVRANGLVAHPGLYPLVSGMRASDLVCAAGGLSLQAYGLEAELSRYEIVNGDKRHLEHVLLSSDQIAGLCRQRQNDSLQGLRIYQESERLRYGRVVEMEDAQWVTDIIDPVYFASGEASIATGDLQRLQDVMLHYQSLNQQVELVVTGHTDNVPLSEKTAVKYRDNIGLSRARAREVAEVIAIALRLNRDEYSIRGLGANQPIASNAEPDGRAQNRRSEISLKLRPSSNAGPVSLAYQNPDDKGPDATAAQWSDDDPSNPFLRPHDQLTFVQKPNWIEKASVRLSGEVTRPGIYVIDRGETLCQVMQRAGGVTGDAYIFGAEFTRQSIRDMQQKTLDGIQDQLDDLLVELSMSHSARNDEKTPAGDSKDEYLRIINQLDRAEPNGRMVIDLDDVLDCKSRAKVALENGDELFVPRTPAFVNVAGQVYVPTSHMYRSDRDAKDYIELSGGGTVIGRVNHAYVVQANGEVMSYSGRRSSDRITRAKIQPGAEIVVPLNLDRMNLTERVQSWTRSLVETALFAGILL